MEPEGSLPHSQAPATWPYPELYYSGRFLLILLVEDLAKPAAVQREYKLM